MCNKALVYSFRIDRTKIDGVVEHELSTEYELTAPNKYCSTYFYEFFRYMARNFGSQVSPLLRSRDRIAKLLSKATCTFAR